MDSTERPPHVLHCLVLAPYGRDAALLREALAEVGGRPTVCGDLDELLTKMQSAPADLLVISDDAFACSGDDRVLAALRGRCQEEGDILPLVALTGNVDLVHPLTQHPGVVVVAKPTRRRILASVLRGALDTRRRVLELRKGREEIEARNRSLHSMTEELETRNLDLAHAMQAKDRFLASMSHELRTPLNSVLSYAELLDLEIKGPLNTSQRTYIERITLSAHHLLELIAEVLDFAKLTAGKLEMELGPIDLVGEVERAVTLMVPRAGEKGLHLTIQPPFERLPPALGDRLRIRQVLLNLLSNAIKFTDRGSVTIRFRREDDDRVSVLVEDSGIGIGPAELSNLFTDFFQADNSLARRHDGAGLGLAISKRLTLLMGGDLFAESRLGHGSVFTFTLPLAPEQERGQ